MNIKPLGSRIVVERTKATDITKGGIVLPDSAKEKPKEGTVVAVGDGKLLNNGERAAVQVSKGDRVLFGSYAGTDINVDDKEYIVLNEDDVLAILND